MPELPLRAQRSVLSCCLILLLILLAGCPPTPPSDAGVEPDAGAAEPDAGAAEPDAGAAEPDAGAAEPDAGAAEPDAGAAEPDAGAAEPDAGAAEPDAGAAEPDAGAAEPDAGMDGGGNVDGGGEPEPLPAYYDGIDVNATGATLANALQMLLTTTHDDLNYDEVIDAYTRTDSGRGTCSANEIFDFYSDRCWNVDDDCGQYNSEGDCYNREHSWPKSWWGGSEGSPAYADLFHVVPADGWVNNQRGNLPFGDVDNPTYTSSNGSKKGPCASPGFSGDCFEPTDDVKGDLARGYFYMALRYDDVFTCCGRDGVDRADIEPWMEDVLRAWHTFDPVDDDERARNNAVFIEQGNRNPFIDHPSWVSAITDF